MSNYILMAETGADIPRKQAEQYGIEIVPMHVSFGDETRDDGSFPPEEVFAYYQRTKTLPQTSGCNVSDFEAAFDRIHAQHPDKHILYLAYSAVTTCSFQCAVLAAEERDYVTCIDTKQVSAGQAMVVLSMAEYLKHCPNCPLDVAVALAKDLRSRCHMAFFPGDLIYLKAGGRVSNASYLGAKLLSIHPVIEIRDGKLVSTKKYRGKMQKVARELLRDYVAKYDFQKDAIAFVYASGLDPAIRESITAQARDMGFCEIMWIQTGCVVSVHSGPGAFGVVGYAGH